MQPKFVAHEQYDDFRGSIAIDESSPREGQKYLLDELAFMANLNKTEYSPVGFQFNGPLIDENLNYTPNLTITLLATKIAESGDCYEDNAKYGEQHCKIPLYPFEVKINIIDLLPFFNRLEIIVLARNGQDLPFKVMPSDG
jgi:hypothetical protein